MYFSSFPQFYDLKLSSRRNYQNFFNELGKRCKILDLTNKFLRKKEFFINFLQMINMVVILI